MLKVGLTGGIAVGKSFVLTVLRELGCETMDADFVAHKVIEPGAPAHAEIVAHFGHSVVTEDGKIDRAKLGAIVFADAEERARLNAIVHPRVFAWQAAWLAELEARDPNAIAVIDAALMIETGSYRRFDKVIVVHCDPPLQLERLMTRNGLNLEQAQARIAAQMPSSEKLKFADYAIDTSRGFDDTRRQTETIFAALNTLAANHSTSPFN